jgi:hypothetical protein
VSGAMIALGCAWILRGRGGDATARAAATGRLDEMVTPPHQSVD